MKDNTHFSNHTTQQRDGYRLTLDHRMKTTIRVDPDIWSKFKQTCTERGTWTCPVLESLMYAWIHAQKVESTLIKPTTIHLHWNHVVQRPRRNTTYKGPEYITQIGCHGLEHRDLWPGRLGWCHKIQRWITLEDCEGCRFHPT